MNADFDRALAKVLIFEGGKADDPADPGGRTNKGIIQRTYDDYRGSKGLVYRDVFLITEAEVREIYESRFWKRSQAPLFGWPVNLILFDCAVNSGTMRAAKLLQRALGVTPDGILGPATLASVKNFTMRDLCLRFLMERVFYYNHLDEGHPELTKFLTGGWLLRIESLYREVP